MSTTSRYDKPYFELGEDNRTPTVAPGNVCNEPFGLRECSGVGARQAFVDGNLIIAATNVTWPSNTTIEVVPSGLAESLGNYVTFMSSDLTTLDVLASFSPACHHFIYRTPATPIVKSEVDDLADNVRSLALLADQQPQHSELTPESRPLEAVRQLCEWLGLNESDVAGLGGFAVRSVANWRRGRTPYPKTVRRLFGVHALVRSLVDVLGVDKTRLWLSETSEIEGESDRRQLMRSSEGLAIVIDEAAPLIYERREPDRRVAAEFEERSIEDQFAIVPRRGRVRFSE